MFELPTDALRHTRIPLVTALLDKAMTLGYRLTGKVRYNDFRMERIHGLPFVVTPTVLNPKLTRTGAFFASLLDEEFHRHGFDIAVLAERRFVNERLAIFRLRPTHIQDLT